MTDEIASAAELRPIGPDDLADVRSLHATSFRLLAGQSFTEGEIAGFTAHVYGFSYTDALSEAIRRQQLLGAWYDGELIGTAGWVAGDGNASAARIRWVFVRPLFTGLGLGTRLVQAAEAGARRAGFRALSAEATLNSVDFFAGLGYEVTSHGVRALTPGESLPVAYMRKLLDDDVTRGASRGEAADH
ncbi:MAG: GNAT family N-acetyltransferase [Hyphomicrobiaceae bacterium]|nr:GNAT family N-acetyltransferase [Hyphomicrobiaceae bacterium]